MSATAGGRATRRGERPRWAATLRIGLALAAISFGGLCSRIAIAVVETPHAIAAVVAEGPELDGRLDDAVWGEAEPLTALRQTQPIEGAAATFRTEIRIVRDEDALYLGIRCFDDDPSKIIARKMKRDEDLESDDRVTIVLDTFRDGRFGYYFEVNPLAARRDGLIENLELLTNWDAIWDARASIDSEGWAVEIELPFKSLSFDPHSNDWGLNVQRTIRRMNEVLRWADVNVQRSFVNLGQVGHLRGMRGAQQGIGLDVVPAFTVRRVDDPPENRSYTRFQPGGDVYWRFIPSMLAALTANSDFGEAEADTRQLNFTRFSLFFPEKRDFFLQDEGIFEFGGLTQNARPFFSRRIGLAADGGVVPLRAGAKLTGRAGRFNIGLLNTQMGGDGDVNAQNLTVARVSMNVLEESRVGFIVTNGDPQSNTDNTLAGVDMLLRGTVGSESEVLEGRAFYQQTWTAGQHTEDMAYGVSLAYPNDRHNWSLLAREIQKNFAPRLGFAARTGIRQYEADYRRRFRFEGPVRLIDVRGIGKVFTATEDDDVETLEFKLIPMRIESRLGDSLELVAFYNRERIENAFNLVGRYPVPRGTYGGFGGTAIAGLSRARPVSASLELQYREFFTGEALTVAPSILLQLSKYVTFSLQLRRVRVELESDTFTTHLVVGDLLLQFSPRLSWETLVQYDDVSDSIGINSRLRWIIKPGRELFLVFNQGLFTDGDRLDRGRTEPLVKLEWTFRF